MDLNQLMGLVKDPQVQQLVQSLLGAQSGGGGQGGGLNDLLGKLSGSGMQEQVKSWVDTGANQPISGQQLQSALGPDTLGHIAEQAGMSPQEAADGLAKVLPGLVDQATPTGSMPQPSS